MANYANEINKRRTFAIISHPDAGKTTLTQALKGEKVTYKKTQYINNYDVIIDTPGEYLQTGKLGRALALYSYEADVVGLLASSTEPFSLYPPNALDIFHMKSPWIYIYPSFCRYMSFSVFKVGPRTLGVSDQI